ncbi:MAG: SDR family oxidoreductase, partial [Thermoleophilia bacterium]|nr:SDR family oxidoreductase [Thermoleophilia bacterium]
VGDLVCFLASDRAAYVTGTSIGVDGGLTRGLL